MEHINLEYSIPVLDTAEIIVVGGGPAGIAAAISAARCKKKVILIEQNAQLGGMATTGNVAIFMPVGNQTGIYAEITQETGMTEQQDRSWGFAPQFDPHRLRYYFNEKLKNEGVQIFFHCAFVSTIKVGNRVTGIVMNTREGLRALMGEVFLDCTGDARVAIEAGVPYHSGRETDGLTQHMTLMFSMQNTGKPVKRELPEGCYHYETVEDLPQGRILHWERLDDGTLLINMTRIKANATNTREVSVAEQELMKQVLSVADYLQRNGFENYILSHVAAQAGVRETNQIVGLYTLTEDDLFSARKFADAVAQSDYQIDIHSPDGGKSCNVQDLSSYDIPYRCLVPKGVEGLLVAGRSLSATHVAMSSARVMPTCFALGEAAGIAAAIAVDEQCSLADIDITSHIKLG